MRQARRIEFRMWEEDGTCHEVVCGPGVEVSLESSYLSDHVPLKPSAVVISGPFRVVKHAPGYLTDDRRRIASLEAEVERLRRSG